jgi:hypothetical protein
MPTATPAPAYIPLGPGMPFQNGGNMQTLDMLYSAATNKQFITVQTRSGETYDLVIDYDKPIDEEAELYETYFLNLVDDRDLLSVLSEDEMPTPEPTVILATPEPTPLPTAVPVQEPKSNESGGMGPMILLLVAVLAGGGALWYFKIRKGGSGSRKKQPSYQEFEFDDEDEDEPAETTETEESEEE